VADDSNVISRCSSKGASVSSFLLHVGHHSPFWHSSHGKNISNRQRSILAGIDELPGVHALICDECLGLELESVRVAEDNFGERRSSTRVMHYLFNNTPNITMSLGKVERSEFCWRFVEAGVGSCIDNQWKWTSWFKLRAILKIDPRPFLWLRMTRPISYHWMSGQQTMLLSKAFAGSCRSYHVVENNLLEFH
jgi:hypothetical protein